MIKTDIEVYKVDSDNWNCLYVAVEPCDPDGDIFTIGNSVFGDKVYFSPDQIDGLIKLLQELKVKCPSKEKNKINAFDPASMLRAIYENPFPRINNEKD